MAMTVLKMPKLSPTRRAEVVEQNQGGLLDGALPWSFR